MEFSSKLWEARSRPYRRRFLQVNTRWKALDEIYKIYILLHRSDFKISAKHRHHFFAIEYYLLSSWISDLFSFSSSNFAFFLRIFDEFLSGFRDKFQKRVTSVAFQSILRKQIRKLPKFLKFVKIIQYYSILFNRVLSRDRGTVWPWRGESGAKACKSCRSRQELSNAYFLAKFGVDTEENEPSKVWSFGWKIQKSE